MTRDVPDRPRIRKGSKLSGEVLANLVYYFCNGISISLAAETAGVSPKTVRTLYLDLRERMTDTRYNRFHWINEVNPSRDDFLDDVNRGFKIRYMAECDQNTHCFRNFELGNRKDRECGSCPLSDLFQDPEARADLWMMIDATRAFYRGLGIRESVGTERLETFFYRRYLHYQVPASEPFMKAAFCPTATATLPTKAFILPLH